jgi:peptidoglycan hydrolase CwlO-like protein
MMTILVALVILVVGYQSIALRRANAKVETLEAQITSLGIKEKVAKVQSQIDVIDERLRGNEVSIAEAQKRIDNINVKPFVPKGDSADDLVKAFKALPR